MAEKQDAELKDRLKAALAAKDMRAVDLVEASGVPKSAISFYLAGKSKPKADRLYKIAQVLDISEAWLLGYNVPMKRSEDQKKNDQLAKLVMRMRNDEDFYNTVVAIAALNEKQYKSVKDLVAAFNE